jgi:hypothetical protein
MKPKKILIKEKIGEFDSFDFIGSFDEIIARLQESKKYYLSKFSLQENEEIYIDTYGEYEDNTICIVLKRYENDKEYNKRMKLLEKQKKSQKKKEEKELEMYEKLKKKYG